MNRIITTALLVTSGSFSVGTQALADHDRSIRRDFEIRRTELDREFRVQREHNRFAYHRERELLRAERERASRIDCRDTRAIRVRAINRSLSALARDFHLKNREIAAWYHAERDALRTASEIAMRRARRVMPVIVEKPLNVEHRHPADCGCDSCRPAPPVVQVPTCRFDHPEVPALRNDRVYGNNFDRPASFEGRRGSLDLASLLFSLFN